MSDPLSQKINPVSRIPFREIIVCAFLAALALLPSSPLLQRFPFRDSGVFLYAGWQIREGEVPYTDVWDHKPPLIFFIDAAGLTLGNGSVWGVWALEWISLSAACLLAFRLLRKTFDTWASGVSLLLMLGVFSILVLGGNFTTEFALPLQFACFYLASGMREKRADFGRMFLIGAFFACLFLLKQNLVGVPIVIAAFRLLSLWRRNQKASIPQEIGGLAAGSALVILPVLGYFAVHGALAAFWDAAFRFNLYYAETGFASGLKSVIHGLEAVSQVGFGILGSIGWSVGVWLLVRGEEMFRRNNAWLAAAFAALPVELLLAGLSGHFEEHYYLAVLPVFSIFAALALGALFREIQLQEARLRVRFSVAGILIASLFAASATAIVTRIGSYRTNDWSDVTEFIIANSTPDDGVLFWGAEAGLNFSTRRQSPTKYVYQYPLYRTGYLQAEDISEFFNDLETRPPLWIVDTKNPMTPFLEIPADAQAQSSFREWFFLNYSQTDEIHGWTFYRRNGPQAVRETNAARREVFRPANTALCFA